MKNKKKLLLLGVGAMSALALSVGATSTFAWYTSTAAAALSKTATNTSALTVTDKTATLHGVKFLLEPTAGYATSLVMTNRAGRSYYRTGNTYNEIMDDDYDLGTGKKQATMTYTVKIVDASNTSAAAPTESLASVPGTFSVSVTAAGNVKIADAKTTATVTDNSTPVTAFTAPTGGAAEGVLGKAAEQSVEVMRIYISDTGVVTYRDNPVAVNAVAAWGGDAKAWNVSDYVTGKPTFSFFYALEVNSGDAQTSTEIAEAYGDASKIIPSISGVNASSQAYAIS